MFAKFDQVNFGKNIRIFIFIFIIISSQIHVAKAIPNSQGVLTIGALIGLGHVISDQFESSVKVAGEETRSVIRTGGDEARKTLDNAAKNVEEITAQVETTYRNSLNITISSLDEFTRKKLYEVENLFNKVNTALQNDVKLISQETLKIIDETSIQTKEILIQLEETFKKIIVDAGETTVYVIDRFWDGFLGVTGFIVAAVAAALFATRLLKKESFPVGLQGIAGVTIFSFFIILGLLVFFSPFELRVKALAYSGIGINARIEKIKDEGPKIVGVYPKTLLIGEYEELAVRGVRLTPIGKKVTAEIGTTNVPIKAFSEREIILDVVNLKTSTIGSTNVTIKYDGVEGIRELVTLKVLAPVTPPRLVITAVNFELNPGPDGIFREGFHYMNGQHFTVNVTVKNQGNKDSGPFTVVWKSNFHPGYTRSETMGLRGGEEKTFRFDDYIIDQAYFYSLSSSSCNVNLTMENNFILMPSIQEEFDATTGGVRKPALFFWNGLC